MIGPAHPAYKSDTTIIGLSGYARSGKDTVGDYLKLRHNFEKFAFADKLRECVLALNPIVGVSKTFRSGDGGMSVAIGPVRLNEVIEEYGWDGYKESYYGDEIRGLLQRMGTEVGRNMIADDIWVRELDGKRGNIIVTDMRFPNEYERVKRNGGQVWRINRPGTEPANPHISEVSLDNHDFDVTLTNDGDLEDLYFKVSEALANTKR